MNKVYFEVEDGAVIKNTPMPEIKEDIYKTEVVMTKEIFQECYKKWIKPQEKTDVLGKIRAEIEQLRLHKAQFITSGNKVCIDSQEVLDVIDKYKAETER